jgi:hypothetical protein
MTPRTKPRAMPRIIARTAIVIVSRRARKMMGSKRKSATVPKSNRTASIESISA